MGIQTVRPTLTIDQLQLLRGMLNQQFEFRVGQLGQLRTVHAATDAEQEVLDAVTDGALAALSDVRSALRRMSDGSFGACTYCGARLPYERLEIIPQAALCMPCQRVQDALR